MYLTTCLDPSDILHIWIGYSFEYAPLVLKCCYCNVFDDVYLKFVNASYLYLIQKPYIKLLIQR